MTTIEETLDRTLRLEGGFVNHPNDRGGPTKYGITQSTMEDWLGREVTIEEMRNLTKAEAKEIYERNYYTGPRIHTLPDLVQPCLFDMSINHGPRNAVRMLQQVINMADIDCDVDGVVGPQTRTACREAVDMMGPYFVNALVERRKDFFRQIVDNDSSQGVFLKGWLNRADKFLLETTHD